MKNRKAFIFSIDAFVAFSLALIALYSLIFFSAIPFTYYSSLMQAHNLAKDTLHTLSVVPSPAETEQQTAIGYVVLINPTVATEYLNNLIPQEFGYILEQKVGENWEIVVHTKDEPDHYYYKKLKAVSYGVLFDYELSPNSENPFVYHNCEGGGKPCPMKSMYRPGDFKVILLRLTIYV